LAIKRLIVNADDFGISPGVNQGIIEAHERGIVTSTSLMTRWPAAAQAAEYGRAHPEFGIGLHIDLSEWVCRDGEWEPLYQVVSLDDPAAVRLEIHRQLEDFRRLLGRNPDHIDSHQHSHRNEPVLSVARQITSELSIPLRHFDPQIRYCGEFYGQDDQGRSYPELIGPEALAGLIRGLDPGTTELCCHPARSADLDTMYLLERQRELASLCDPQVKAAVAAADVHLCTFHDLTTT
jgi:predicted glycoside hydrolase/deacetylase ChbG (UPF0249 family)